MQAQLFLSRPGCAMPMAVVMNHQEAQRAKDKRLWVPFPPRWSHFDGGKVVEVRVLCDIGAH